MSENPLTRSFCVRCLRRRRPGFLLCACGGDSFSSGALQAIELYKATPYPLRFPWHVMGDWQPGTLTMIAGGPGGGKSSLAALLDPDGWLTTEQDPAEAASILARCGTGAVCPVEAVEGCDGVREGIAKLEPGGVYVVDSISAAGTVPAQGELLHDLAKWTRATGSRLLVIQQVNGEGEGAGLTAMPHLVDAAALIEQDDVRRISFWKNRGGPIGSVIFDLDERGVTRPELGDASYSIEGKPGRYRLHSWPQGGGKWGALFDFAWAKAPAVPGLATAAIPVLGYRGGTLKPLDRRARKAFAEAHGLIYVETMDELTAATDAAEAKESG